MDANNIVLPEDVQKARDDAGMKAYNDALAANMSEEAAHAMGDEASKAVVEEYIASLPAATQENTSVKEEEPSVLAAEEKIVEPEPVKVKLSDLEKGAYALAISKFIASKIPGALEECKSIFPNAF